jgi:hypothetical protein
MTTGTMTTGTMTVIARHLGLALCVAGATIAIGWWGVPIVGFVAGLWSVRHRPGPAAFSALMGASATAAWGASLIWTATPGPLTTLVTTLGHVAGVPGAVVVTLTLCFAGILAWSAALTGSSIAGWRGSATR